MPYVRLEGHDSDKLSENQLRYGPVRIGDIDGFAVLYRAVAALEKDGRGRNSGVTVSDPLEDRHADFWQVIGRPTGYPAGDPVPDGAFISAPYEPLDSESRLWRYIRDRIKALHGAQTVVNLWQ